MSYNHKGVLKKTNKYNCLAKNHLNYRPEYKVWGTMIRRCTNPTCDMYYCYGGRGVKVCDRWTDKERGFINFYNDMGKRPVDDAGRPFQIDRIDVNGNYCPENCRWVPAIENSRNKRTNNFFLIGGKQMCLKEVSELFKFHKNSLANRIRLSGEDKYTALYHILEYKGYKLAAERGESPCAQ